MASSAFYSEAPVVRDRVEHVGVSGRTGESEAHVQLPDLRGGAPIGGGQLDRALFRALRVGACYWWRRSCPVKKMYWNSLLQVPPID